MADYTIYKMFYLHILYSYSAVQMKLNSSSCKWQKMEKSIKIDATDFKSSLPPWKSNDVKVTSSILLHECYLRTGVNC